MRKILLALGAAAITVTIAAAGPKLWETYVAPPEPVVEPAADCTSCTLRHSRLKKKKDEQAD